MLYAIEFVRRVDGKADALTQEIISLVGEVAAVMEQAVELYRKLNIVPRPDGFRIREASNGAIVHEFYESESA